MLQGRWWKKSVLATSSVVIIFSFCYFWSWLQSHEFFELWSLINSLFPNFHPFLHPFLIYPLTCLIAIFNYYYFQFEKPLHSQCCSVIPAKLVDLLCPLVWVGRWREPRIHAEEPERQGARSPTVGHTGHSMVYVYREPCSRYHSSLSRSFCSASRERNAAWLVELGFLA